MSKEQNLFEMLAFCWEGFERDGLNDVITEKYLDVISGEVAVFGSGQGIVSRRLIDLGHSVTSVDSIPKMAEMAKTRRDVDTIVCDLLELPKDPQYQVIILNTGVISPSSCGSVESFANVMNERLLAGGKALVAFFAHEDFDDFALKIALDICPEYPVQIWRELQAGGDIFSALKKSSASAALTPFWQKKFANELKEYEEQIRYAGERHLSQFPGEDLEDFLGTALRYIPFGLSAKLQARVVRAFEDTGLELQRIDQYGHTILALFGKENNHAAS